MMWRYDGGRFCPFCGGSGDWGAGGLLMMVFGILVLAGIILFVIWVIRQLSGDHHTYVSGGPYRQERVGPVGEDPAIAEARQRYARGEIDREELDRILATLRETR